ncbi:MAG TPA: penicillin-binding transpeptidase domain-containing protein [Candidatus Ozemobacteraceae bacterium]|nr:penicillin-binding transpeptidase domain-containing protein [Candidatus Ozemobacteraceae bacterium]
MKRVYEIIYILVLVVSSSAVVAAGVGPAGQPVRGVLLESVGSEPVRIVSGDPHLVERWACPASVFKLVIAWAGLEAGVLTTGTRIVCNEPRVASSPVAIGMRDALLRSSNTFFEAVAGRLGEGRLTEYVHRSGLFREPVPDRWLENGMRSAVWGGMLNTTPARLHAFTRRIAAGEVGAASVNHVLTASIEWPCGTGTVRVFGKSGTMRQAVWFTGFGRFPGGETRCVTVFLEGGMERRLEAAARFFGRFGLRPPAPPPLEDEGTTMERGN